MSEAAAPAPDETDPAPKSRKSSNPKSRKAAKSAKSKDAPAESRADEVPAVTAQVPEEPAVTLDAPEPDWPEPEEESAGADGGNPQERPRKKRRRKKARGGQAQEPASAENPSPARENAAEETPRSRPPQNPQAAARAVADPQLLAKKAWKIYLAEVSEEGVALIGDSDAKDLARRCFRLAEIFIEEQARRR